MKIQDLIKRFEAGGKGEIVGTQTTYLDISCIFEVETSKKRSNFRIHYHQKREFDLNIGEIETLGLSEEHPLLLQYTEAICSVQLVSPVEDKRSFLDEIDRAAKQVFNGWRPADSYSFMPLDQFIEKNFGILMVAPRSYAEAVIEAANNCAVKLVMDNGSGPQRPFPLVLFFDNWYVIADGFRIEELS